MYKTYFKPLIDIFIALSLLCIFFPIIVSVAVLLFIVNKGEVFFIQERPGKDEVPFHIIKFKTMNSKKDKNGILLPDEKRLTRIGKFVRKYSLDELPQLFNIIHGDISLIGPRPLLMEYLPLYSKNQKRRHEVKPGISGWAQVNGRNAISWNEKFELDLYYVDNLSFLLDMKILFMTIRNVFLAKDINSASSATMEKFTGNISN